MYNLKENKRKNYESKRYQNLKSFNKKCLLKRLEVNFDAYNNGSDLCKIYPTNIIMYMNIISRGITCLHKYVYTCIYKYIFMYNQ